MTKIEEISKEMMSELSETIGESVKEAILDANERIAADCLTLLASEIQSNGIPRYAVARGFIEALPHLLSKGDQPWAQELLTGLIDAI